MTNPRFRIQSYNRSLRQELFAFLSRVYSAREAERLKQQWTWKYDNNPLNRTDTPFVLLLRAEDTIIGMLAAIPLCIVLRGVTYPMMHSCDLVIDPAFRGQGLADMLIHYYTRANPVGFGWLNERSHRRAKKLKRTHWTRLTPLIRPLNPLGVLRTPNNPNLATSLVPRPQNLPAFPLSARDGTRIEWLQNFDARFDQFWNEMAGAHPVLCVRDRAYLSWRFAARPDVSYAMLAAVREYAVDGYLVVRTGVSNGIPVGYFVDLLARDPTSHAAHSLLRAGLDWLRAQRVAAVKCVITTPAWRRALLRQGFIPWNWGAQPYFYARSELDGAEWEMYRNVQNWHLTMGDGDFEMSF
jgi:GNAT superfamily N-acetyltransferase